MTRVDRSEPHSEPAGGRLEAPAVTYPERRAAPISRLLQDSSFYLLANAASRVVGFLAIPFYSRFLSPAQYGLIELIELSTQTVAIAFGLQAVGAALSRLYYDQRTPEEEHAVVSTSLLATAFLSAVVTIVAVFGSGALSELVFHTREWASLLQAAFIGMFFSSMIEIALVYERIQNRARFFLFYSLITLSVTLLLNILFIGVLQAGVWGFVSSKLIVTSVGTVYLLVRVKRSVGFRWRGVYIPQLFTFGAPLVLSSLSYFAIHFSDRFFLSSSVSLDELGRYALAYKFAILVSAVVGDSFSKSWGVTLYRYVERPGWRAQFTQVASYFTFALFVSGFGIVVFSPELFRLMVPASYFPPALLLPVIVLSYLAREIGDFFRTLLLINKRSVVVGNIAAAGALLNLAANFLLIPTFGIFGAAIATLITWAGYMVACWWIANAEHRLPMRKSAYVMIFLLVCVFYAAAAASRTDLVLLQLVLDGVWVLGFTLAAAMLFLTTDERNNAFVMGASVVGRLVTARVRELPPGDAAPAQLLVFAQGGTSWLASLEPLLRDRRMMVAAVDGSGTGDSARGAWRGWQFGWMREAGWVWAALKAGAQWAGPGTVLLSTSSPAATHLAALALYKRYGCPWIADFSAAQEGGGPRRARFMAGLLERAAAENAAAVTVGAEADAEQFRARYPACRARIHVLGQRSGESAGQELAELIEAVCRPE